MEKVKGQDVMWFAGRTAQNWGRPSPYKLLDKLLDAKGGWSSPALPPSRSCLGYSWFWNIEVLMSPLLLVFSHLWSVFHAYFSLALLLCLAHTNLPMANWKSAGRPNLQQKSFVQQESVSFSALSLLLPAFMRDTASFIL